MTQLAYPYQIGADGRTASTDYDTHVRDMIEQVLFTTPGERVNRPSFGSGLLQAVFDLNSDQMAATLQHLAQTALSQWLGDVIDLRGVQINNVDSTLNVTVQYVVKLTNSPQQAQYSRAV